MIMEIPQDDNLVKSLHQQGCGSIKDVLSMKESHIMSLEYTDKKSGKTTPVLLFWKSKLRILKAWSVYLKDSYGDFESIVNIDAFNSYCVNEYDPELPIKTVPTPIKVLSLPSSVPTQRSSPLAEFRQSQERDKSHYIVLKDEDKWDDWRLP